MTQSDYDHREEGESLFEWPLDSAGMRMGAGELLDSLLATIQHLNRTDAWRCAGRPGTPPDLGGLPVETQTSQNP